MNIKNLMMVNMNFIKKWFPLLLAILSGGLLFTLFIYLLREN
jgi:hypothetical protein